jgi:hypothetical protein
MTTLAMLITALSLSAPASAIAVDGQVTFEVDGIVSTVEKFDEIPERSIVTTGENSSVSLRFKSGSMVRLASQTQIEMIELVHGATAGKRKEKIKVLTGKMWARIMKLLGRDSHFEIITKHAAAGVRGTAFWVSANAQHTQFTIDHGKVSVETNGGPVRILQGAGASASIGNDGATNTQTLSAQAVEKLRLEVNGSASSMIQDLRDMRSGTWSKQRARNVSRRSLKSPDQFRDGSLGNQRPGDTRRGSLLSDRAIVDVDLEFPDTD